MDTTIVVDDDNDEDDDDDDDDGQGEALNWLPPKMSKRRH